MIYLDNAATTKISQKVLDEMMPYLTESYGNPGSVYELGRKAAEAISIARKRVADFIGADPDQIVFTSGGSEANNLVIKGTRDYLSNIGKRLILTSKIEHDSLLKSVMPYDVLYVGADEHCIVHPESIDNIMTLSHGNIGLVSVMYVNNETGSENNITDIRKVCEKHGALFHTDCVQAAGCQQINVKEIGCDFLSISSHKIYGPKGVGALFAKDKRIITPQIRGGSTQEFGLRGGTENVAGIVGFGKACELAMMERQGRLDSVSAYRKMFYNQLVSELSTKNIGEIVHVNGEPIDTGRGKTLNIRFDGVDSETLLLMLDAKGICVSAGSACRSHESNPSHVLTAIGLTPDEARESIRVSFSDLNIDSEVNNAACIVANCVASLKGHSVDVW